MQAITEFLNFLDSWLGSAFYFPLALLGVGLFFTIYLGAPQLRFFGHAWGVLAGKYSKDSDPGDTTHFQALSTALSGTVGTGNIGGVAFAIFLGGPAALFWMWMTAFIGMTTKYAEVTISHRYRQQDDEGKIAGGPMYYMEHGLGLKGLAIFFAIATVISSFGTGSLPQSNNMASGLEAAFNLPPAASGAVFAALLALVILGGIRRIARVAATIVPFMGLLYAVGALAVVASNFEAIGPAFGSVFRDAFTGSAAAGGFLGATFAYAFNRGVNRGLYSNEAGQGSAPIAHAAAKTKEPVAEGMVAILEPFIDTLVICTLTGLVILSSGVWTEKFSTEFSSIDMEVLEGRFDDRQQVDRARLFGHLNGVRSDDLEPTVPYSGSLQFVDGAFENAQAATVLHNRSVAESLQATLEGQPFTGTIAVDAGRLALPDGVVLKGLSLLHSVPLTMAAFERSFLGPLGSYIVSIGLALFAFSTALAWSYYGDRAVTYLVGVRWVTPYRWVYVAGFFLATIADTSLIWLLSAITLALMTLPNLLGLLLMRKEIRLLTERYWGEHRSAEGAPADSDRDT